MSSETGTDTLRDEQGEPYSPSWGYFALTRAGRVVAIDQDDRRLVLFDSGGRQIHATGRVGSGPGEFRFPRGIFSLPGDSVAVWDIGLRRLSLFDSALKFVRTEQFEQWDGVGGESEPVGRLDDGRWVARVVTRGSSGNLVGARLATDTVRLVVGLSHESPVTFHALPVSTGVDVGTQVGTDNFNTYILRLSDLDVRVGAVCDSGAVLVDDGGVRRLDRTGRVSSTSPLPRLGDTIRTAAERRAIVNSQVGGMLDSSSARSARALLEQLVVAHKTRGIRPTIDFSGRLWYKPTAGQNIPSSTIERLDAAGKVTAALAIAPSGWGERIGAHSVLGVRQGSDTTGILLTLSRVPSAVLADKASPIGWCYASFTY